MTRCSWRFVILFGIILTLQSCLTQPAQPETAQSHALLVLPDAIQLLALDTQSFDDRMKIRQLRLPSGSHTLLFAYVGSSPQHVGQHAEPVQLRAQTGHQYVFEAKT